MNDLTQFSFFVSASVPSCEQSREFCSHNHTPWFISTKLGSTWNSIWMAVEKKSKIGNWGNNEECCVLVWSAEPKYFSLFDLIDSQLGIIVTIYS